VFITPGVNEGVNIPRRGQISPLGAKFTPRGEVYTWGPVVKLRMALSLGKFSPFELSFGGYFWGATFGWDWIMFPYKNA
jgi:hypothetical protein